MLELRAVSKRYGGVVATDDVTLDVVRGPWGAVRRRAAGRGAVSPRPQCAHAERAAGGGGGRTWRGWPAPRRPPRGRAPRGGRGGGRGGPPRRTGHANDPRPHPHRCF